MLLARHPINIVRPLGHYLRCTTRRFSQGSDIAFVFDIDGVLLRGSKALPTAKPALELLNEHKVPFILLTNGGGVTESARASFLSSAIGVPISPLQIVQSHTPMKAFAHNNQFDRVLVVGGDKDNARECANEYGFKDVIMPIDIVNADPSISAHHRITAEEFKYALSPEKLNIEKPVSAILVFNDARDMGTDTQIILDLLNSENGVIGTKRSITTINDKQKPSIPIVFSNNDFLWANDYKLPRFGQGALRIMIEALYKEVNGLKENEKLQLEILGKPFPIQYDFAHNVLIDWNKKMAENNTHDLNQLLPKLNEKPTNSPFRKIYMVGDNPASDIMGANVNGWESLLLRTGVYKDADWDTIVAKPSGGVHDDVLESIRFALRENSVL